MKKIIQGNIADVVSRRIFSGELTVESGKIISIEEKPVNNSVFIIPGFVDAHIHIESSMVLPTEFARHASVHGTVACVCDPHEIANVSGIAGVDFMIENGRKSPMKFFFGAPSCVPATDIDTSGAIINSKDIAELLQRNDIYFLAEMMDYEGVVQGNEEVRRKLQFALDAGKPIDGHAPNLTGADLVKYAAAGISTDHECMTTDEALEKIELGMNILIREGSAAKNFDALIPLIEKFPEKIMFCSDDKHPDDLIRNGHINQLVKRAISAGYDILDVLRAASYNPVKHYRLNVGLLQPGDDADFVIVDNLSDLNILKTYIKGEIIVENGTSLLSFQPQNYLINQFKASKLQVEDIHVKPRGERLKVIVVSDGQLFTHAGTFEPKVENGNVVSDTENDILKLVVYNRYENSKPSVGFIKNIGLKKGALASTVSHDSHNIVAVGTSDTEIVLAMNKIIDSKGGILVCSEDESYLLPLPVGGLMSPDDGFSVAKNYELVDAKAKEFGSGLNAPFMTVAFMSLLVIPELKLTDKGLFDGINYGFTHLME
jgi:adenine deaminase